MHKRPHSDSEVSAEEADSSEISKPATKIIRVDDSPRSSSDKCIQVDSAAEATGEPGGLSGPSTSAITNSNVDAATAEEDNAIDLVSSNTNHSSTSTETTIRCSNNDASTDDPTTITTSTTTSSTTATSSSSSIDDTCEPSCDIAPSHDETPSASPNSTEPTSSIEEGEIYQDQPLNEDAVTVDDAVIEEVPSYAEEQAVATSSSSVNASLDEPDMTPSTSSGIRHVPSRRTQSILKTAERKLKGKRSVVFNGVTVYYFRRSQGFTCIPSQGGSTLGMENSHTYIRNFTLETHAEERKRAHREILQRQRRFARMNKHSSTSESEDDSYDDMSDLSDVDLENDNCYFLQPVPIKQRRALLRASGVRKIETSEKEECRDIRISREFCGCECQVYCNPEICACYLAGIKCQVDRMAFPCGCSKDGCHNENGRIEFNPMRVRTHFIHTIMKIEMEKKQEQQQQQQQQQQMASSTSNGGGMISTISSTDGAYCGAPCTSSYSSPISNQCSQSMQQGMYAMPMVHNNTAHSGHHYISESSHMHLMPPNNSYADPNIYHTNEYSPDSSYSENSDYTTGSDEFENENGEKTDDSPVNVVTSHEMYSQHQHQQQQQQQQPHPSSHQYASNGQDMMHSCANSNALPPFPSINSSCDLSAGGTGYTKNGHCHSYQQDSGGANSMHLNHYNSYSAMTDSLPQPPQQQQPSQHASLYSYDIHSSSSHYTSYSNGFHKGEPNFASMGTGNVAVATTSHLSAETSPPLEHPQQQHQHQHQQQQQQQQPVNSSSQQQMVGSEGNSIAAPAPQQQYIDLSLSIASSSSAESLLSAANTSDEDSRLTPVSFTHIQPLSSSSSFYTVVTNNSSSLGHHPYDHQDYSAKGTSDHHLLPQCSSIAVSAPYGELSEADPKSSSSSSDSSSESNLSSSDNFGEIIKKSIVETDIFSPRPPSSASASPSMSVEAPSSGPCDPSPTSHATQQGTNMPSTAAAANEDSVLFATPLGPAPKRRGRPPKNVKVPKDEVDSTETENTDSTVLLPASQGESRRRSSRLKKLEKEKEPDLNGISNGHTLSNTHHTASKEKSKSKKHRHHKKHELDHPTATTDCQITAIAEAPQPQPINAEKHDEPPKELESSSKVLLNRTNEVCNESYPKFEEIDANIFCCERKKSKGQKEIKKMVCDCILSKEDRINGFRGCGDDCLNRMLMIECGSRCTLGDLCSNKRFSLKQYAKVEPFKTLNKGWGLRTLEDLPPHSFIMEYVGEVVDAFDFYKRVEKYEKRKTEHHYFMVLQADEFIDATRKGNVTRFINHSCDPNSQTEKWTVNGELRVGFFTFKHVKAGEEITFDYQFQRYGKKAQKCFCGTDKCCGYIGGKSANILTDGSKIPTKANKSKKKTKKVSPVKVKDEFKEGGDEEEEKEEEEEEDDDDEEEEDNDEDDDLYNGVDLDEEQISNLEYEQRGLRNRQTTLEVSQIMIRTEKMHLKLRLIKIIMSTVEIAYLRLFLDYYGLKIIRNWMLSTGNDAEDIQLKARLLELLMILPIPNKTMLIHNKVLETVERWAQSDSPESSQYINPPNADATNKVNGDDVGGDGENGVKEESEEAKKSPAEELPKLAEKLVTKSSAKEETEKSSPTAEENITIGQLAQKVLDHWKDLIFVLRIPRLEIEKRHADEAEADRKTKEDEDKQTHQTPASAALKRPNEEEYHAGGHKRRFLRSLTDAGRDAGAPRRPFTGNHNHTSSNHRDDTASAATLAERQQDKEHRRRMFEYNEYQNAVIKWRKQMDDYNMQVLEISPLMALQQLENGSPLSVDSQSLATSITPGSASTLLHPQLSSPLVPGQAPEASGDSSENPTSIEKMYDKETEAYLERKEEEEVKIELTLKDIVPKFDSPLIILLDDDSVPAEKDVTLSPHAIDNVDYNEVRYYCDDVFESMEKRLFDEIYPPQGIFYIAPTGETYFLSMPSDLSQSVTVRENVAEPLPLSYTKRTSANIMLPLNCDWSCAEVEGETYYFNKHKQIKQWNPPQSNQIGTFTPMIAIPESKPLPLRIKRNKELVDLEQNFEKHIPVENRQHLFRIRRQLSAHVVKCLSPYNRRDCKHGRITSHEDFKYLARKITHHVIYKEYQHQSTIGKPIDKMVCSDSVKGKTKEYVKAYMNKYKREYRLS